MTTWPGQLSLATWTTLIRQAGVRADAVQQGDVQPEDGGHSAGVELSGGFHTFAAFAGQCQGILEGQGAGSHQGAELTHRVAGHERRAKIGVNFQEDAQGSDGVGEQDGLGVVGVVELGFGAFPGSLCQVEPQHLFGLHEGGARHRVRCGQLAAHANGLRALAGENESGVFCVHMSFEWHKRTRAVIVTARPEDYFSFLTSMTSRPL